MRPTEIVPVERKVLGKRGVIKFQVLTVMIAWMISFGEHPLVRHQHAPALQLPLRWILRHA